MAASRVSWIRVSSSQLVARAGRAVGMPGSMLAEEAEDAQARAD